MMKRNGGIKVLSLEPPKREPREHSRTTKDNKESGEYVPMIFNYILAVPIKFL